MRYEYECVWGVEKKELYYVAATDSISSNNIEQCERNEWIRARKGEREREKGVTAR